MATKRRQGRRRLPESITVDPDLWAELVVEAERRGLPTSRLVEAVVSRWFVRVLKIDPRRLGQAAASRLLADPAP